MFIYIYCSYKTKENISDIHGSKRVEEWGSSVGVIAVFTDFPRIYTIIPQGVRKVAVGCCTEKCQRRVSQFATIRACLGFASLKSSG